MHVGNLGRRIGQTNLMLGLVGVSIDTLVYHQIAQFAPDLNRRDLAFARNALKARPASVACSALVRHERKRMFDWLRGDYLKQIDKHTEQLIKGFEIIHEMYAALYSDMDDEFDPSMLKRIAALAKNSPKKYHRMLNEYEKVFTSAEKVADLPLKQAIEKWPKAMSQRGTDNPFFAGLGVYSFDPLLAVRRTLFGHQAGEAMLVAGLLYLGKGDRALNDVREPETNKRFKLEISKTGFKLTSPTKRNEDSSWSLEFGWPEVEEK